MTIDASKYIIRPAVIEDVDFLVETVLQAEKSSSGVCGMANYFEITENELRNYIKQAFEEEVDGCELSISSFIVVEYDGKVVAALGGWLEGNNEDKMPSPLLKSNLLMYVMPRDIILKSQENAAVIKDLNVEKELDAYQLEYSYILPEHQGQFLLQDLTEAHIVRAKNFGPFVHKIQGHAFEANKVILLTNKLLGFKITKRFVSNHPRILEFYPYNTIVLMEKEI
ncbi:MAG: hypothetical protein J6X88_01275 [Bacteroidales bacterium]|nr:hypothetical protein [Bacteroidales bacterium]